MVTGIVPHVGGPILPPGVPTVLIGFLPAATVTNMATCVGPPDIIVKGSAGVFINYLPAARMGDLTAHGGVIVLGEPTVMIGEIGAPSPGAGGAGAVMAGLVASGAFSPKAGEKQTALLAQAGTKGAAPAAQAAATITPEKGPASGWDSDFAGDPGSDAGADAAPAADTGSDPAPQTLNYQPSSGAVLATNPDTPTTLLGRWVPDMQNVKAELNPPESTDTDCGPGKFNFLNVPSALADAMSPEQFFETYNQPWLAAAVQRGDDFLMCTAPASEQMVNPITGKQTTFGREIEYLAKCGYYYDPLTRKMTKAATS